MANFDLDFREILSLNVKILSMLGLYKVKNPAGRQRVFYLLRVSFIGALFFLVLLGQLFHLITQLGDIKATARASYLPLTNLITALKILNIIKRRHQLNDLINTINRKQFQPKTAEQRSLLLTHIKMSKKMTVAGLFLVTSGCTLWACYPVTVSNGPFLPLEVFIPFSVEEPSIFWLTFAFEAVSNVLIGYAWIISDCFMSGFLMVICAQTDILNDSLRNMENMARTRLVAKQSSSTLDDEMVVLLVECVDHHRHILGIAKEVTNHFTTAMFGQFFFSVVILCTTLFDTVTMNPMSAQFISMILYMIVLLLEIFWLCYFGNEIVEMSSQLTNSAYHCNWLDRSVAFKRTLLFFMTNSQVNMHLYAGHFVPLTLLIFGQIVKSSLSYYTFLRQVSEKM